MMCMCGNVTVKPVSLYTKNTINNNNKRHDLQVEELHKQKKIPCSVQAQYSGVKWCLSEIHLKYSRGKRAIQGSQVVGSGGSSTLPVYPYILELPPNAKSRTKVKRRMIDPFPLVFELPRQLAHMKNIPAI